MVSHLEQLACSSPQISLCLDVARKAPAAHSTSRRARLESDSYHLATAEATCGRNPPAALSIAALALQSSEWLGFPALRICE